MDNIIQTKWLDLIPLSAPTIRTALAGDWRGMGQLNCCVTVPASWEVRREYLELRLR